MSPLSEFQGRKKQSFLKPVTGEPKPKRIAVFDIESNNWTDFEMLGFYDGQTYTQFDSIESFAAHVFRKRFRGYWIYAHFGGKFDVQFILNLLNSRKRKYVYHIVTQGPKALAVKIQLNSRNNLTFVDSSGLFSESLESLCRSFKPSTGKMVGAIDFEKERVDRKNPVHREYLRADCISLYEIIQSFCKDPKVKESGLKITMASQAMDMWKRTLKTPLKVTDQKIQDFVRQSYYGGRCEIFKMEGSGLRIFDVNSLYPFCLRYSKLPTEFIGAGTDPTQFGFHDITVEAPLSYIPVLPLKFDGKLLFPTGTFRGVYFSEEIKLALIHGYKILKYHGGSQFDYSESLFTEYIDYWYKIKNQAEPGSAAYWIAKHAQNDLYGKFGQREEKQSLKRHEDETIYAPFHSEALFEKTGLIRIKSFHRSPHMLVHIASACTSYARIHMAKNFYLPYGESLYYTDTDCLFTRDEMPVGSQLGALKLEKGPRDYVFRQPKAYASPNPDGSLSVKLKGFPRNKQGKVVISDPFETRIPGKTPKLVEIPNINVFRTENLHYERIGFATLKTSLIRNECFLSRVSKSKEIKTSYSKRRVLPGGETEPLHIQNGVIQNG